MKPQNIILEGICGSQAYGLANEDSDADIKGIYVAPTSEVLGLPQFNPCNTIDHTDPDWVYHEIGRYISLALKANPTVTELIWLEGYRVLTKQGHMLVDNRHLFLSTPAVKNAYTGYCYSQAHKLIARGGSYGNGRNKRYEKHTRHLLREEIKKFENIKSVLPDKPDVVDTIYNHLRDDSPIRAADNGSKTRLPE